MIANGPTHFVIFAIEETLRDYIAAEVDKAASPVIPAAQVYMATGKPLDPLAASLDVKLPAVVVGAESAETGLQQFGGSWVIPVSVEVFSHSEDSGTIGFFAEVDSICKVLFDQEFEIKFAAYNPRVHLQAIRAWRQEVLFEDPIRRWRATAELIASTV